MALGLKSTVVVLFHNKKHPQGPRFHNTEEYRSTQNKSRVEMPDRSETSCVSVQRSALLHHDHAAPKGCL